MVGKINIKNITIKRAIRFVCTFLEHFIDQEFRPKVVEQFSQIIHKKLTAFYKDIEFIWYTRISIMNTIKQYLEHLINFLDYIQGYTILQKKVLIKNKSL